jgi:hypothetical protein
MLVFQRRNGRKVLKLARLLATLDDHARATRPAPKRTARAWLSA